jgi:Resolvase, N terminal domain
VRSAGSLAQLVELIASLGDHGLGLRSLSEAIDTPAGVHIGLFDLIKILSESERAMLVERTQAGLQAAKQKGQKLGCQRNLSQQQIEHTRDLRMPPAARKPLVTSFVVPSQRAKAGRVPWAWDAVALSGTSTTGLGHHGSSILLRFAQSIGYSA